MNCACATQATVYFLILMHLRFLLIAVITFFTLLFLDVVWVGGVMHGFYQKYLGALLSPEVGWTSALGFYAVMALGLAYFAIQPALHTHSLPQLFKKSAFLGLIAYVGYDLTNLATIRDWPVIVSVIDLVWGVAVSVAASIITYSLVQKIKLKV